MVPILMVAALLAAPPARAADWTLSPFEGIWARLSALWAETGCVIDPNGHCRDQAAGPAKGITADAGCTYDPNGLCRDQAGSVGGITADAGCIYDPDGRCRDVAQTQASGREQPRQP
jgi:hypothetical protein